MTDRSSLYGADRFEAITPSDTTDIYETPRGIYVGGAGDIVAINSRGVSVTFTAANAGATLPIQPKRIMATGTTATALVALY